MAGTIDSKGWTGGETPAPAYRDQVRVRRRPLLPETPHQYWGHFHAMVLLASPLLLWVADWVLRASSADLSVTVPAVGAWYLLPAPAALALLGLMRWDKAVPVCRRVAQAGWLAALTVAALYVDTGVRAHDNAAAGPALRAQIVRVERQNRNAPDEVVFALQDGGEVRALGYRPGFGNRRGCFLVRRIEGGHGFSWLRILEISPGPGSGQLDWPVDRAACFSAAPLASLRG
jgi:hypothetical protein